MIAPRRCFLTFAALITAMLAVMALLERCYFDAPDHSSDCPLPMLLRCPPPARSGGGLLAIVVLSHASHTDRRMAIRKSWAMDARTHNYSLFFVLGTVLIPSVQTAIEHEAAQYNDILQVADPST